MVTKTFFSLENQVITRNCLISIYSSVQLFQWTFSFCWQSNFILCRKTVPQRVRSVSCHRKSLQSLPIQAKLYLKKSGSSYRAAEGRKTILQTQNPFPIWLCIACYQGPAMAAIKKPLLPYCGSPELFFFISDVMPYTAGLSCLIRGPDWLCLPHHVAAGHE